MPLNRGKDSIEKELFVTISHWKTKTYKLEFRYSVSDLLVAHSQL